MCRGLIDLAVTPGFNRRAVLTQTSRKNGKGKAVQSEKALFIKLLHVSLLLKNTYVFRLFTSLTKRVFCMFKHRASSSWFKRPMNFIVHQEALFSLHIGI